MCARGSVPGELLASAKRSGAGVGERRLVVEQLSDGVAQCGDVIGRDNAPGTVVRDSLAETADVVDDRRHPGAERLQERPALVELRAVGEDCDGRVTESTLELLRREIAEP